MEPRSDGPQLPPHPPFQIQRSLSTQMDYPVQFWGRDVVPPVKIFYHPSMEKLARGIVELVDRAKATAKEVSSSLAAPCVRCMGGREV